MKRRNDGRLYSTLTQRAVCHACRRLSCGAVAGYTAFGSDDQDHTPSASRGRGFFQEHSIAVGQVWIVPREPKRGKQLILPCKDRRCWRRCKHARDTAPTHPLPCPRGRSSRLTLAKVRDFRRASRSPVANFLFPRRQSVRHLACLERSCDFA